MTAQGGVHGSAVRLVKKSIAKTEVAVANEDFKATDDGFRPIAIERLAQKGH
jgi:hypothetical protein